MSIWAWIVLWVLISFLCGAIYGIAMYEGEQARKRRIQLQREFREELYAMEEAGPDWTVIGGGIAGLYDDREDAA